MKWVRMVQNQIYWQALMSVVLSLAVILSKRMIVVGYSGIMFYETRRECGKWLDLAQVFVR